MLKPRPIKLRNPLTKGGIYVVGDKIVHSRVILKITKKDLFEISFNHGGNIR